MMISPDMYYENLKDKSKDQILKEINELKGNIKNLEAQIDKNAKAMAEHSENPDNAPEIYEMDPSYELQLDLNREYLDMAVKDYEED